MSRRVKRELKVPPQAAATMWSKCKAETRRAFCDFAIVSGRREAAHGAFQPGAVRVGGILACYELVGLRRKDRDEHSGMEVGGTLAISSKIRGFKGPRGAPVGSASSVSPPLRNLRTPGFGRRRDAARPSTPPNARARAGAPPVASRTLLPAHVMRSVHAAAMLVALSTMRSDALRLLVQVSCGCLQQRRVSSARAARLRLTVAAMISHQKPQ